MFGLYNEYQDNPKFKEESDKQLLQDNLFKRQEIMKHVDNLTLEKLNECQRIFSIYIFKHGETQPVQTSYPMVNYFGNYLLSYTHYIHTKQPTNKTIKEIIDEANQDKHDVHECRRVFNALMTIKKIYDVMSKGETKDNIYAMFKKFNLDLNDTDIAEKMIDIENMIKGVTKQTINPKQRIRSRYFD